MLGITGIYLSSVLKTKVEGFQTGNTMSQQYLATVEIIDSDKLKRINSDMSIPLKDVKELNMLFDAVLKFLKMKFCVK